MPTSAFNIVRLESSELGHNGQNVHVMLDNSRWQWSSTLSHSFILHSVATGSLVFAPFLRKKKLHWSPLANSQLVFFISPKKVAPDIISSSNMTLSKPCFSRLSNRVFISASSLEFNFGLSTQWLVVVGRLYTVKLFKVANRLVLATIVSTMLN